MAQRKHAELIKQWADDDSLEFEVFIFLPDYGEKQWVVDKKPEWLESLEYRIKPTKPSIDWSHVADEYKWLSTSRDGFSYLSSEKPTYILGGWDYDSVKIPANGFKSFKSGKCDIKDSLVQRPAKDGEE